jgi:hypothetical protein
MRSKEIIYPPVLEPATVSISREKFTLLGEFMFRADQLIIKIFNSGKNNLIPERLNPNRFYRLECCI